ncbi:tellurite resistance/C4-dicarboxylate transporter family protein [Arthrobacter castelli]|uniref:tellurite resistance/C4-dicarboxylate transporter family protein n=1 Tax=Arthrobacter castelli TaxID=271431 RepID=UPI00041A883B|nr:tellurite resistance/C4-dicarboxylate transporter family protein [Arthrobacter castelli]
MSPYQQLVQRTDTVVRNLPPAAFAFVMATAITALGFSVLDKRAISLALISVAAAGGVVLMIATIWRLVRHADSVMDDVGNASTTFGFFTIVAACDVLGAYASMSGHVVAFTVLAVFGAAVWLLLTYALPARVLLVHGDRSVLNDVNGSWFLWVVGTQSVATSAAIGARHFHPEVMSAVAVGLWGVGIALYMIIATLVTLRMLVRENPPSGLSPVYWIYMGATAISVLAGSRILLLPEDLSVMRATEHFVSGMSFLLWSLGMWWIPLLIVFGIWRHGIRRVPVTYEAALWSIVFPMGMYSVASILYGATRSMEFMVRVGQTGIWVAALVWALATVAMIRAGMRWFRTRAQPPVVTDTD